MYDFVSPEKLIKALTWLKANHPLYVDIDVNMKWIEHALADDCDLFCALVEQPDHVDCENSNHNIVPQGHARLKYHYKPQ